MVCSTYSQQHMPSDCMSVLLILDVVLAASQLNKYIYMHVCRTFVVTDSEIVNMLCSRCRCDQYQRSDFRHRPHLVTRPDKDSSDLWVFTESW